jgi:hypothetical protein
MFYNIDIGAIEQRLFALCGTERIPQDEAEQIWQLRRLFRK